MTSFHQHCFPVFFFFPCYLSGKANKIELTTGTQGMHIFFLLMNYYVEILSSLVYLWFACNLTPWPPSAS